MTGHHLILGEIEDVITAETIKDTHDERYRQKIARLLIHQKGYLRSEIEPRRSLVVCAGDRRAAVKIDFVVHVSDTVGMIIKYGPGSLVTRRRPALAAARLAAAYQIPIAVVTNGEDAEVLNGSTGAVLSRGLKTIPSRSELKRIVAEQEFKSIPAKRAAIESRIIYCYEVDGRCPCDEDICML